MIWMRQPKKMFAVCKSYYRNFTILETGSKYFIFEGIRQHEFGSLSAATGWVDEWYEKRQS